MQTQTVFHRCGGFFSIGIALVILAVSGGAASIAANRKASLPHQTYAQAGTQTASDEPRTAAAAPTE
ncbi:MAG: hypothetical protein N3D71_08535 [Burkholderiaceae bacterium]|nr:hypothetical protein [Burkholderiaceae bacterium]